MTMSDDRLHDLIRFYDILDVLAERIGGPRILAECTGRMRWPERGVYFFQECGENRSDSGTFLLIRRGRRNVKRWRNRAMAWRWAGTVLLDVEKRFHRIKGYRDLVSLLRALGRGPSDSTALAPGNEVA